MAGTPALALVVRSTFFHVEVSDELLSDADGASPRTAAAAGVARPGRDRRRSASCPSDCRRRDKAAAGYMPGGSRDALVYVADTLSSVWRRLAVEGSPSSCGSFTSVGEGQTLAAPPAWAPPECRMPRWPASCAPQHDLRRRSGASDTSTAASTPCASDDGAEPVMPMRPGLVPVYGGARKQFTTASSSSSSSSSCSWSSYSSVCRGQALPGSSHSGATATGFPPDAGSTEDLRTTVMMRNVPSNYTRDRLRELLDAEGFFGRYDFMYFPTDFRTASALGFAFVNLASPADATRFRAHFGGFRQWAARTSKVCNVSWASADQQGLEANIERYRNSSVMHGSVADEHRPLYLVNGVPEVVAAPRELRLPGLLEVSPRAGAPTRGEAGAGRPSAREAAAARGA
eukprot:CAMPEP_0204123914 /NCGR_PEP_ID=MMETSP0361-20130328/9550_1 /ASSEMBLY_ACC=CAM_ASM_000343 /TAXON_ID=268821 /ORGANISM="Scrippsiella Hangoei, Strain SHTV-5" /LENGTH=400 /DNA_ID=CAMNT_0051075417 /DNA_START=49 /DNA_END=1248 /DNA_ORIENTATION=+